MLNPKVSHSDLMNRIDILVRWIYDSHHLVVFTGAGISTDSGIPDFRGPDGLWTRKEKGLPVKSLNCQNAEPNQNHFAIYALQNLDKLKYLISQNIDNLHIKSGIKPDLLAELHGNITRLRCIRCEFSMDNQNDNLKCPQCNGDMRSSVVDFGQSLPEKDLEQATFHSQRCDLFIVVGSSLVVTPAAEMPRIAVESGAKLVIVNQGETPLDHICNLRFSEQIKDVLPEAVERLTGLMKNV
jgi:NAD-dependent deacetylase